MTHISEQVATALRSQGFAQFVEGADQVFIKTVRTSGQFGKAQIKLTIDATGRWFSRVDGWGKVEKDLDLRNFEGRPSSAVGELLD